MILQRNFYRGKTLIVAKQLLGCFLVRKIGRKIIRAKIVETEAYIGENDLACHASRGRTRRTETMYGAAGHAYVYMIYGMYHCLNIVTEAKNCPAAVLIRAVEAEGIPFKKTNGPGKLCRFLKIDRKLNGIDITGGDKLRIERGEKISRNNIAASKRIGIDYAEHCKDYPWRFSLQTKKMKT